MEENKIYLTKEEINKLKDELKQLIEVERPKIIQEIKDARAQGDLSENAEYDAARDKQGVIEDRIHVLENMLNVAVELKGSSSNVVGIGSIVEIKNLKTKKIETFQIVSTFEADPFENKISNKSPLAVALNGKSKGQIISVDSPIKYDVEILNINRK